MPAIGVDFCYSTQIGGDMRRCAGLGHTFNFLPCTSKINTICKPSCFYRNKPRASHFSGDENISRIILSATWSVATVFHQEKTMNQNSILHRQLSNNLAAWNLHPFTVLSVDKQPSIWKLAKLPTVLT